ncbi:hypothetical protein C8F01DRAFT_1369720, partial [Mycena amicta]
VRGSIRLWATAETLSPTGRPSTLVPVRIHGKEIVVQQDVAARNDKTTKRGRFIHKELELELIKPDAEEIQLTITSEEEYWAL